MEHSMYKMNAPPVQNKQNQIQKVEPKKIFEQEKISDKCVCCGEPATKMVYWGKAY